MAQTNVEIHGLSDLHTALQTLPSRLEANVLGGAMRAGMRVMRDVARQNLFNAGAIRTEELWRSVRVRTKRGARGRGVAAVELVAGNAKAWYAHLVEFGSGGYYSGRGTKSRRQPYKIRAKPGKRLALPGMFRQSVTHPGIQPRRFMRDAIDTSSQASIDAAIAYMRRRIPIEIAKRNAAIAQQQEPGE